MSPSARTRASQPHFAAPTLPPLPQKGERRPAYRRNTLQPRMSAGGGLTRHARVPSSERCRTVNAKHPRAPSVKGSIRGQTSFMRRLKKHSYCGGHRQSKDDTEWALGEIAARETVGDDTSEENEREAAVPAVRSVRGRTWSCVKPWEVGLCFAEPSATGAQRKEVCTTNLLEPGGRGGSQPPSQPQEQEHSPTESTTAAWPAPAVVAAAAAVTHVTAPQQHRLIPAPPPRRKSSLGSTVSFQRQSFLSETQSGADAFRRAEAPTMATAASPTGARAVAGGTELAACNRRILYRVPRPAPRQEVKYKRCRPPPLSVNMLQSRR
ncbi:hypothetical protein STCU_11917 [Strigomonas culicis]|uniref:Uncharacterized protein n=1 Tax=Strigomonas culicis TaxID=28005 RepID=S9TC57_9TRYP|nr:hypothetical protein STCU_11917 [Strigomonas culicis]|eukprot:EPY15577.1 hypothetical protein STCU_11917 [Strigomonas culicis]